MEGSERPARAPGSGAYKWRGAQSRPPVLIRIVVRIVREPGGRRVAVAVAARARGRLRQMGHVFFSCPRPPTVSRESGERRALP